MDKPKITLKLWNPATKTFEHEVVEQRTMFDCPQFVGLDKRKITIDEVMYFPILNEVEIYAYPKVK